MAEAKYYPFLNVALDVFCGVVLYSSFAAFSGFALSSLLMAFAVFVVVDYWWNARSSREWPKYHLVDFLFVIVIMFIFSQWPDHFGGLQEFLPVLISFLFVDAAFSALSVFIHKDRRYEKALWYFAATESVLGLVYLAIFFLKLPFALWSVSAVAAPYLVVYFAGLKTGRIQTKFADEN